ncbi:DNA-directed RNA polymerase subunit delta [Risungbinella massiliensis]|uniref:DNA-directed RNA polymerase subunit delta n=1 Tax=Risungbinella massiliensis TaxID=1329796 RepID=UPI000AB74371|nr:DNA-directed RNA polymerase subunit delta [Risungbinella massiliensis]
MSDHLVAEKIRESSMVDLVFQLLKDKGEPLQFRDMMKSVAEQKQFTDEDVDLYLSQLYTDLNIDGRFVCVGKSTWGLKDWYTLEQGSDSAVVGSIKDDESDDDFDEDLYQNDEDEFDTNLEDLDEDEAFTDDDDEASDEGFEEEDEDNDEEEEEEEY